MKIVIELADPKTEFNAEQLRMMHSLSWSPDGYTELNVLYKIGEILYDMEVEWSAMSLVLDKDCEGNW